MQILKERPPFVRYEYLECGIDADLSKKAGRPIPKVLPHVLIMQHGSKDETIKLADEWLAHIRQRAIEGLYNPEWVTRFEMQYEQWQKGNELPREGTPVKTWHAVNREQAIRLTAIGLHTVEDLAAVPDSALGGIGLDGRYLRDLAKNHIAQGIQGIDAKRMADLEQSNRDKDDTIKRLNDRLEVLEQSQAKRKSA